LVLTNASDKGATNDAAQSLSSLKVVIPVKKLDTDKSSMNDNMYDALKADDNPNITYELTKVSSGVLPSVAGDSVQLSTTGVLSIAGKQNVIEMNVVGSLTKDGKVQFKGQKKIKMTDFGVDPPTMLFGTIRTGDEVTIKFDLLLAKK
jgi:polyisoprenoid-binding protein YceI